MLASLASISSFCMCAASSGDTSSSSSSSTRRFALRDTAAFAAFPASALAARRLADSNSDCCAFVRPFDGMARTCGTAACGLGTCALPGTAAQPNADSAPPCGFAFWWSAHSGQVAPVSSAGCGSSVTFQIAVVLKRRSQTGQVGATGGAQDGGVAGNVEHVRNKPVGLHVWLCTRSFWEGELHAS